MSSNVGNIIIIILKTSPWLNESLYYGDIFIKITMMEIDVNERLPIGVRVDSIEDILYSIGLSLTSVRDEHKNRKFYNKPILIFICNLLFASMRVLCLFTNNETYLTYLGDYGHIFNIKFHTECLLFLFLIMTIL